MKRFLLISALLALFACDVQAQNLFGRSRLPAFNRQEEGAEWIPQELRTNCVLWFGFNFNDSTIVYDLSGNNNTGAVTSATWTDRYYVFDADNDKIQIPAVTSLNLTGNLTIMAWIYPRSMGEGGVGRIYQRAGTAGLGYTVIATNRMLFYAGGGNNAFSSQNVLTLNQWQHIAVTRSGTAIKFYVNGVQAGTSVVATITGESVVASVGSNSDATRVFDGYIDRFAIFNTAATSNQVYRVAISPRQEP